MADTGWLKPAASTIATIPGTPGNSAWSGMEYLAASDSLGTGNWIIIQPPIAPGYPSEEGRSRTQTLAFDWVVPAALSIPSNAILTGIELVTYPGTNQGDPTRSPIIPIGFIDVQLGDAIMFQGSPDVDPFFLHDNDPLPGPPPNYPINLGGPTFMGGVPVGTRVLDFLAQNATTSVAGNLHAAFIVGGLDPGGIPEGASMVCSVHIRYAEMKLHYEVDANTIDLPDTEPETVVSATGDLQVIHKLAALCAVDVLIEQAQLGNIIAMKSTPTVEVGLPADLTNGLGFIDSTALPTVVVTIPDLDLALIRFSDMRSSPDIEVSAVFRGAGRRINIASSPKVSINLQHGFTNVVGVYAEPVLAVSMTANLSADTDMVSSPKVYVTLNANLQGDINLGSECSVAELTTVVSLIANLGYARGLYSNPHVAVTLDGDGLVVGAALEFSPLVSVTIPFANLVSKFAEPAPDHRTVFKCPVDRTIRITRKDKTIL